MKISRECSKIALIIHSFIHSSSDYSLVLDVLDILLGPGRDKQIKDIVLILKDVLVEVNSGFPSLRF